jgi:hypothetical protein
MNTLLACQLTLLLLNADTASVDFFEAKIRPVFIEHCEKCHNASKQQGGFRLDSKDNFFKGPDSGPIFNPTKPSESKLLKLLHYQSELKMPPKGKLPDQVINDISEWIIKGAPWPTDSKKNPNAIASANQDHWAFKPIKKPAPPKIAQPSLANNEIDLFIQAKLEQNKVSLSPQADKRTLIRRLYFVLIGLPPTPQEVESFLNDSDPQAYPKLVNRLLNSSHFGERWARHWLDLARYADNRGYIGVGVDRTYPYAYTFRDWVIQSFNNDLPYDKFLTYQIAADNPKSGASKSDLAALGFFTVGRRFINNQNDIIDDRIDVLCRTTMGLTVTCARCHDHKYDPIPTKDYYSLYGVFASSQEPEDLPDLGIEGSGPEAQEFQLELAKLIKEKEKFETDNAEIKKKEPRKFSESIKPYDNRIKQLKSKHPGSPPKGMVLFDKPSPEEPVVFIRGNQGNRGPKVPRQFLEVVSGANRIPFKQGSGRFEAAQAIVSDKNTFTSRVWVNRVWAHVFGNPLVKTPSDFGIRSDPPSHPDLLDFLASNLIEDHWSTKNLIRQMLLSSTFKQTSSPRSELQNDDPENSLLIRMNRRRLDFETMHDSLLAMAGTLEPAVGGRSVEMFTSPFSSKRALYAFIDRQNLPGVLRTFDFALPDTHSPQRFITSVPQQALYLLNSPFVQEQATKFTLRFSNTDDRAEKVQAMYRVALQRSPTKEEVTSSLEFLEASGPDGFKQLAQVLLASNAFQFID